MVYSGNGYPLTNGPFKAPRHANIIVLISASHRERMPPVRHVVSAPETRESASAILVISAVQGALEAGVFRGSPPELRVAIRWSWWCLERYHGNGIV